MYSGLVGNYSGVVYKLRRISFQYDFTYVSAYWLGDVPFDQKFLDLYIINLSIFIMESDPVTQNKKRTLSQMLAADLMGRLKSKQDFITYFDQQ